MKYGYMRDEQSTEGSETEKEETRIVFGKIAGSATVNLHSRIKDLLDKTSGEKIGKVITPLPNSAAKPRGDDPPYPDLEKEGVSKNGMAEAELRG